MLTPENVEYVIERALALVREDEVGHDAERDRRRLAQVEAETERAVDQVVHTGGRVEAVARKLEELEAEKRELLSRLERAPAIPSQVALREIVRDRVLAWRSLFEASPEEGRNALAALLAGRRMRVHADSERAFRVEGLLRLPLTNEPPRADASGRFDSVVAGERFGRTEPRHGALPPTSHWPHDPGRGRELDVQVVLREVRRIAA